MVKDNIDETMKTIFLKESQLDLFTLVRAFIFVAVVQMTFIYALVQKTFRTFLLSKKMNWIIGVMATIIMLSTLLSKYRMIALFGFADRYEGMLVYVSYLQLFLLITYCLECYEDLVHFEKAIFIGSFGVALIGGLQLVGLNPFESPAIMQVLSLGDVHIDFGSTVFKFGNQIYSTLYNPNFVGSYMALLLPYSIWRIISERSSKKYLDWMYFVLIVSNWLGCFSNAGYLGGATSIFLILILNIEWIKLHKNQMLKLSILFVVAVIAINFSSQNQLFKELSFIKYTQRSSHMQEKVDEKTSIESIVLDGARATIETSKNTLKLEAGDEGLKYFDGDDEEISLLMVEGADKNIYGFDNEKYNHIFVKIAEEEGVQQIVHSFDGKVIRLSYSEEGLKIVSRNHLFNMLKDDEIDKMNLFHESFANNRGFIWNRSIPIAQKHLLLGVGPDVYPMYFPQSDFIAKINAYETASILIDKPHNLYLQYALNFGLVGMALYCGFQVLIIIFWYKERNNYYFEKARKEKNIVDVIVSGMIGYHVAALFNDSNIQVSITFWSLIAILYAVLVYGKNKDLKIRKRLMNK